MRAAAARASHRRMEGNSVPASESPEYRRLHDDLAQTQADAMRQPPRASGRHSRGRGRPFRSDPLAWVMEWILVPVAAALVVLTGAFSFGPALAAAREHGTEGYFVAEAENCFRGSCGWVGDFVTPDGRVMLRRVQFMGPHGSLYRGARLAALDTGGHGEVYARRGSRDWMTDLAAIVGGGVVFGFWAWRVPYGTAREQARRSGSLTRRKHRGLTAPPPSSS